ncbi:unnamed protein product [Gongylonema pulchrum]|uniref:EGF-like domain-containing protein n=1 Tax=Gongylonema pulchrum TaxID=637853 RepID=A0A3P7MKH2_9BILA|nr:unnamed protein product [Gongylonema pulchrum]
MATRGTKFPASSTPVLQNTPKHDFSRNANRKEGVDLSNLMSDSIEYLKKMLGLTPDCLNGGLKTLRGECVCPKFYRGELCEEIVCINNGTLIKVPNLVPARYACKCPHPEYIHGAHCELVKCLNGGRPMDNGYCKCLDYWYTGQFCQEYTASWGAVLGLPLICMVIIILCCVVCRLDLFPRKPVHSRSTTVIHKFFYLIPLLLIIFEIFVDLRFNFCESFLGRRRTAAQSGVCGDAGARRHRGLEVRRENARGSESYLRLQENLLNEAGNESALVLRPDRSVLPSYIIRLDTIPVFNPHVSSNITKPMDPPPSYEQAVTSSSISQPINDGAAPVHPPEYTPYPPPPPPRFRPPETPRSV